MSSSDQIRVSYIEEVTPGEFPASGDLNTARVISESLSGTPRVLQNDEVGSGDRQSTGQSIVGLDVGGAMPIKLSYDTFHHDMLEAAMMDTWSTQQSAVEDITYVAATGVASKTGGTDFTTIFSVGDIAVFAGFSNAVNNVPVYITAVSADSMTVLGPDGMVDETGSGTSVLLEPYVEIGTTERAFTFLKDYLDLTNKSITYLGNKLGGFSLNFAFGAHIEGEYTVAGTGWDSPTTPDSNGRTIVPIGTETLLNASQDMGLVVLDDEKVDFCIKTLGLTLDNGLLPIECIGHIAPTNQDPGEATVTVTMEAYNADTNFDLVKNKMDNTPVGIAYYTRGSTGKGYAFQIPAIQLSFPDPMNEGKNTKSMLNMEGTAKKDTTFGNTMRIYKLG